MSEFACCYANYFTVLIYQWTTTIARGNLGIVLNPDHVVGGTNPGGQVSLRALREFGRGEHAAHDPFRE